MNEILRDRIRERMDALGMNPSSVSLEAGLSRSAVRDILSGKAKNPGMMTLHSIARVLKCSDNYLMGYTDEKHYREATDILIDADARRGDSSGTLEAGIFRQAAYKDQIEQFDPFTDDPRVTYRSRKPLSGQRRYQGRDLYLYVMGDNSLTDASILKDDILIAMHDAAGEGMGFKDGKIYIISHRVPGLGAEEVSARIAQTKNGKVHLLTSSKEALFAPIIVDKPSGDPNIYETTTGGKIEVEGLVVEVTRQLDM
ncbi:helix-turn-helix domain-containing protein [Agrobacterium radiobacter]|uniref:helix-turn-helix domain-containing protein n=1 Tax=Agrobacterium radiobacter TaxID=362 RepID=UPI003F8716AB